MTPAWSECDPPGGYGVTNVMGLSGKAAIAGLALMVKAAANAALKSFFVQFVLIASILLIVVGGYGLEKTTAKRKKR